ncbi:T9SS type A sorting domain-containing protein [Pedobacter sp. UBA4863]|uniref:T9SS type A sorting domain-containing protein n=1 Tax=Pedobacter sp. UBA4863 TaxID=1947060 RepID=UPI0025D4C2F7|nr:T9SS type A sorting domain-containing protein [Pedobacter sp. UBA4863]
MKKSLLLVFVLLVHITSIAQWSLLGNRTFSPNIIRAQSIATDKMGTPYVAFSDGGINNLATVMKFNGANWVVVGNRGFSFDQFLSSSIAVDKNDNIYVGYPEGTVTTRATVKKFNGSSWTTVGTERFTPNSAGGLKLTLDTGGVPYIVFIDGTTNSQPSVMKFDGTNWVLVGIPGMSAGTANDVDIKFDHQNTPYVAYHESLLGTSKVSVKKFDGNSWVQVGIPRFSPNNSIFISLAIHPDGSPYVGFLEADNKLRSGVMRYNGLSWSYVGGTEIPIDTTYKPTIAIDPDGTPFMSFTERNFGYKATVVRYSNGIWKPVGRRTFTNGNASEMVFTISKLGSLFICYQDSTGISNNGWYATVMTFNCPQQTTASLCLVTTDTVTGNNTLIWDASSYQNIDSFRLFREQNGNFIQIANAMGNVGSYIDASASQQGQPFRYKLSTFDSCGGSTDISTSPAFRPVRVNYSHVPGGMASLTWNAYEGIVNPVYHVRRSNNNGSFQTIASFLISGLDTTFVDSFLPSGNNRYRIEAELSNPCIINGVVYNRTYSNIDTAWATNVPGFSKIFRIDIMPNPASDMVKLTSSEPITKIEVIDMAGRVLISEVMGNEMEHIFDISMLPNGINLLRINGQFFYKIVKQ